MKKWIKISLIIAILLFAFFIRLFPIRLAHWWDETVYLQNAETIFSHRINYDEFSFRPPLLSIMFAGLFFVWHSPIIASILVALIGAAVALSVFFICNKLYGYKAGIVGCLLTAFLPFLVLHSNFLLTDVPSLALIGISFYFALQRDNKFHLFLSGIFLGLSVLMRFTSILIFPVFALYFLLYKMNLKKICFFALGSLLVLLPYFIWSQIVFGNPLFTFVKGSLMVNGDAEQMFYYFSILLKFLPIIIVGFLSYGFLSWEKIKSKDFNYLKIGIVFIFWILIFLVYLSMLPHKESRYLFPIVLPLVIVFSIGIGFIFDKIKKRLHIFLWILLFVLLVFFIVPRINYIHNVGIITDKISDEMKVADYLKEINYSGVIYSNQRWPVFAYYTGLETKQIYPYSTDIYDLIPKLMKDPGIFIGQYDAEKFAPFKNPTSKWMNRDPRFVHLKDIGNFYLYQYKPMSN